MRLFVLLLKQPMKERLIQLLIAAIISLGGLVLLFCGEYIDPAGEIHETVLIAFGEAATFAGSIIGIDYHYKSKYENRNENHNPDPTTDQRQSGDRYPNLRA